MISPEHIAQRLKKSCGAAVLGSVTESAHPHVLVDAAQWPAVARTLRDELGFNLLRCVSGLDLLEDNRMACVYDLHAMRKPEHPAGFWGLAGEIAIRIEVDRAAPVIPSVAAVWPAADWHEREAYDMFGIRFTDHPDSVTDHDGAHPRRILCPDDWVGYPLRKDYLFPMEYHGIPATTEFELTSPRH